MKPREFEMLLRELDPVEMASHSVLNHHVNGVDYLCLHRSDRLTVKLYFIEPDQIDKEPGSYLVTPHTHRYSFESTLLAGHLIHETFREADRNPRYERFEYRPETRERVADGECDLWQTGFDDCLPGDSYWNGTKDIHTLLVPGVPVLLGLVQFSDAASTSKVYIRTGSDMVFPDSRVPTPDEAQLLRCRALRMMGSTAWPSVKPEKSA